MKTTLLTCILGITCGTAAMAQVHPSKQQRTAIPGTVSSKPLTGNKTTAADSRLVGTAMYMHNQGALTMVDSTQMYYYGKRSYDAKIGEWLFDNSKTFDDNYTELYRVNNTFDAKDRLVQALYQTFDAVWYTDKYERYEYTPAGDLAAIVEARFDGSTWDSVRSAYTYDAKGNVLTDMNEYYDFTNKVWVGINRSTSTYTPAGKEDTWLLAYYDKAGSQWVNNYRSTNTFNTVQQLIQSFSEEFVAGNWNNSSKILYTYNTAGLLSTELYQLWNSTAFADANRYTYVYNGNDLATLTSEINYGGSFLNSQQTTYLYNGQHQQTEESQKSWDNLLNKFVFRDFDKQARFYYKDFSTGVSTQPSQTGGVNIYPIPAGNELNLDVNFATPQHATVMLFDMTGRMVKQLSLPAAIQHSQRIDVSSLPAGHYTVQLNAGGTHMMQHVNIVK